MAKLEIRIYGDPILNTVANPIETITPAHQTLAEDMIETMYTSRGIGLAANQIGVTERIIVVDVNWADRDGKKAQPRNATAMINPEVIEESAFDDVYSEGCLSLPEIEGDVWRPKQIRVRYQTLTGETIEREAAGLEARCILHEIDHLNGILFIERMVQIEREKLAGRLAKLRKSRRQPVSS